MNAGCSVLGNNSEVGNDSGVLYFNKKTSQPMDFVCFFLDFPRDRLGVSLFNYDTQPYQLTSLVQ